MVVLDDVIIMFLLCVVSILFVVLIMLIVYAILEDEKPIKQVSGHRATSAPKKIDSRPKITPRKV